LKNAVLESRDDAFYLADDKSEGAPELQTTPEKVAMKIEPVVPEQNTEDTVKGEEIVNPDVVDKPAEQEVVAEKPEE
jgi:hypothetical protein